MRQLAYIAVCSAGLAALASTWLPAAPARQLAEGAPTPTHVVRAEEPAVAADELAELPALHYLNGRRTGLASREHARLAEVIVREANRNGLDPELVLAVIRVESGGYNFAVSRVGAQGLMQLMPPTGEELARKLGLAWHGPDSLFDPQLNVRLGTAYLKQLLDRYDGDEATALAAYNWGPGAIDRRLRSGAGVPTRYTQRVLEARVSRQLAARS